MGVAWFSVVVALVGLTGASGPAWAQAAPTEVPSGQPVSFLEVITDQPGEGLTYRFRFVAPNVSRDNAARDLDASQADMQFLCERFALPRIANTGPQPNQVVISLADRETEFGVARPEATQLFEAYSISGGTCHWEPF